MARRTEKFQEAGRTVKISTTFSTYLATLSFVLRVGRRKGCGRNGDEDADAEDDQDDQDDQDVERRGNVVGPPRRSKYLFEEYSGVARGGGRCDRCGGCVRGRWPASGRNGERCTGLRPVELSSCKHLPN